MMNKDKDLEELFLAQKPHFDDGDAFMASLNKRLDAVEYIKQHQEAAVRRYKTAMLVAFIAGIISGGIALAFALMLAGNLRLVVVTALSLLIGFGMLSIVKNVQDILDSAFPKFLDHYMGL